VDTPNGEWWFLHFQDAGPNGRIVHLQPMKWVEDWPVIGDNGTPVIRHQKPNVGNNCPVVTRPDSDEFNGPHLGLQWQWQASPQPAWAFPSQALGVLRVPCLARPNGFRNFWDVPNLLLQKFPGPKFPGTAKVTLSAHEEGDETGLIVMGTDYARLRFRRKVTRSSSFRPSAKTPHAVRRKEWRQPGPPAVQPSTSASPCLPVPNAGSASARMAPPMNRSGEPFTAKPGQWIGAIRTPHYIAARGRICRLRLVPRRVIRRLRHSPKHRIFGPAATTTYCLPSSRNVIGDAFM
jgi:hypothetical protein